jgi:hypothetical protein
METPRLPTDSPHIKPEEELINTERPIVGPEKKKRKMDESRQTSEGWTQEENRLIISLRQGGYSVIYLSCPPVLW